MRRLILEEAALLLIPRPVLPPSNRGSQKVLALQRVYRIDARSTWSSKRYRLLPRTFLTIHQSADTVKVNLRKHQTANPALRSSRLGVSCPLFSRCKAALSLPTPA